MKKAEVCNVSQSFTFLFMSSKSCMLLSVEVFKQISPVSVEVIPAMREMEQDDLMFPSSQS